MLIASAQVPLAQSAGSGTAQIVFLVLMVGVFYFLLIRPQQRRARAQKELQRSLELGDEVMTVAGFIGTIKRFDGDIITLELSPGVEARCSRRAISGKIQPPEDDLDEDVDEDATDDAEAVEPSKGRSEQ